MATLNPSNYIDDNNNNNSPDYFLISPNTDQIFGDSTKKSVAKRRSNSSHSRMKIGFLVSILCLGVLSIMLWASFANCPGEDFKRTAEPVKNTDTTVLLFTTTKSTLKTSTTQISSSTKFVTFEKLSSTKSKISSISTISKTSAKFRAPSNSTAMTSSASTSRSSTTTTTARTSTTVTPTSTSTSTATVTSSLLTGQCNNSHVNNLLKATSKLVPGWKFKNIHFGQHRIWSQSFYRQCGNGKVWYGFGSGGQEGSMTTRLSGCGHAILDFGNCWDRRTYKVEVYLNEKRISRANGSTPSKIVGFDFTDGDILKLKEDGAIIKFNKLTIINCKHCTS